MSAEARGSLSPRPGWQLQVRLLLSLVLSKEKAREQEGAKVALSLTEALISCLFPGAMAMVEG